MLKLLSPKDAAFIVYSLAKKEEWQKAFNPDYVKEILQDEKKLNEVIMYEIFLKNAILAGELPAQVNPKGKPEKKKFFEHLEIPKEMFDFIPQYDYWITQEDLFVFIERPPFISKEYPHGRDALARLLCVLIDEKALNEKELIEFLSQKIETAEISLDNTLKLGDNTLKSCCREILDTFLTIKSNGSENS